MDRANVVIIGGGVVGCALACEIAARSEDVFLLEQMPKLGMATSTRNSGVVHSGIYYPPGSLKARLCVSGNILTKEFCAAHGVPHNNCGKIVVAAHESEIAELERLAANGRANGVEGLQLVDRARIREREPHVTAVAALEVPSTGIVEAEALVKAYARIATDRGANILTHARVTELKPRTDSIAVAIEIGDPADPDSLQRESIEARCVVNAAGLYADEVAAMLGNTRYRIYPVRGEYAEVNRSRAHLVNARAPDAHHVGHDPGGPVGALRPGEERL
jgi:L-2-hydroxyglutarate oxidase LhgO